MPDATARKTFTFGGCLLTHVDTAWIGDLVVLMLDSRFLLLVLLLLSVAFWVK